MYRGTTLVGKCTPLGPYRRPMPRASWWSWGGGRVLMSQVPLYSTHPGRYEALSQVGSNVIPRRARPGLAGLRPHRRTLANSKHPELWGYNPV